jgi:hypothetical protein
MSRRFVPHRTRYCSIPQGRIERLGGLARRLSPSTRCSSRTPRFRGSDGREWPARQHYLALQLLPTTPHQARRLVPHLRFRMCTASRDRSGHRGAVVERRLALVLLARFLEPRVRVLEVPRCIADLAEPVRRPDVHRRRSVLLLRVQKGGAHRPQVEPRFKVRDVGEKHGRELLVGIEGREIGVDGGVGGRFHAWRWGKRTGQVRGAAGQSLLFKSKDALFLGRPLKNPAFPLPQRFRCATRRAR